MQRGLKETFLQVTTVKEFFTWWILFESVIWNVFSRSLICVIRKCNVFYTLYGNFGVFSESCAVRVPANAPAVDSSCAFTSIGLILRPVAVTLDTFWAKPFYHAQNILFPTLYGSHTAIFRPHQVFTVLICTNPSICQCFTYQLCEWKDLHHLRLYWVTTSEFPVMNPSFVLIVTCF